MTRTPGTRALWIIGAGPVGLMLALRRAAAGDAVTLWESRTGLPSRSMAIGITPPTLDMLERLGLRADFERAGVPIRRARVYEQGRAVGSLGFEHSGGHILSLPQGDTLRLLRNRLARFPQAELLENRTFTLQTPIPEATRVIGCDGAHSTVRTRAGISWRVNPYRPRFVMADFEDIERAGPDARLFFSPRGSVESFPLPGGWRRWIAQVPPEAPADSDHLIHRVRDAAGVDLRGVVHGPPSPFHPRFALADTYTRNDFILCGDAAHVMSPIGGQGMNTGLADAWTLADVLDDPTPERLARWQRERRRAFRQAATRSALGMGLGTWTGPLPSRIRALLLRAALHARPTRHTLARTFAMRNLPRPVSP